MGLYKYIRDFWRTDSEESRALMRERLIMWRREPRTFRINRPTRLDRARSLGYKAIQGVIVVRQRLLRGGRQKPQQKKGRRPKRASRRKNLNKSYQVVAEERANKSYKNCEVVGSYKVAKDGKYFWFEVILADRNSKTVKANKKLSQIVSRRGKSFRGLTAAKK